MVKLSDPPKKTNKQQSGEAEAPSSLSLSLAAFPLSIEELIQRQSRLPTAQLESAARVGAGEGGVAG